MTTLEATLRRLFAVNVLLQLFDGYATWQGIRLGFGEANPLIRSLFPILGVGATLLLFKALSCAFLVTVRRMAAPALAHHAMLAVALAYTAGSVIPWTGGFIQVAASLAPELLQPGTWLASASVAVAATTR